MSKINKYKTSLNFDFRRDSKEVKIRHFSASKGLSIDAANSRILSIDKELQKSVTFERLQELRREVNPSGIMIPDGEVVQKRKYTRKIPLVDEVVIDTITPITKREFKTGDTVKIIANRAGSINRIGDIGVIVGEIRPAQKTELGYLARVEVEGRSKYANNSYLDDLEFISNDDQKSTKAPQPIKSDKVPGVFNIGDKVKVIGNSNHSVNKIGDIGIVISNVDYLHQTVRVKVGNYVGDSNNTRLYEIEHYIERPKTPEEIEADLKAEKEWFGCFVPTGTIINTSTTNNSTTGNHIYILSELSKIRVQLTLQNNPTARPLFYTIKQFNSFLNSRYFRVINATPEIEARIGVFDNIAKEKDFIDDSKSGNVNASLFKLTKNAVTHTIAIGAGFTGNCQLTVIGNMATLLINTSDLKAQLKEIHNWSGRKLLLCDIRKEYLKQLQDKLPKHAFNTISPYTSTNGSNMVICILNISNL